MNMLRRQLVCTVMTALVDCACHQTQRQQGGGLKFVYYHTALYLLLFLHRPWPLHSSSSVVSWPGTLQDVVMMTATVTVNEFFDTSGHHESSCKVDLASTEGAATNANSRGLCLFLAFWFLLALQLTSEARVPTQGRCRRQILFQHRQVWCLLDITLFLVLGIVVSRLDGTKGERYLVQYDRPTTMSSHNCCCLTNSPSTWCSGIAPAAMEQEEGPAMSSTPRAVATDANFILQQTKRTPCTTSRVVTRSMRVIDTQGDNSKPKPVRQFFRIESSDVNATFPWHRHFPMKSFLFFVAWLFVSKVDMTPWMIRTKIGSEVGPFSGDPSEIPSEDILYDMSNIVVVALGHGISETLTTR